MELDVNFNNIDIDGMDWTIAKVVEDKLSKVKIGYWAGMLVRFVVRKYLR